MPDLVGRATPWMVALVLVEALINHFHRWHECDGDDDEEEDDKLRILPQQNTALLSHVCLCIRPWTGVT